MGNPRKRIEILTGGSARVLATYSTVESQQYPLFPLPHHTEQPRRVNLVPSSLDITVNMYENENSK